VKVETTDLYVRTRGDFSAFIKTAVYKFREKIKDHIKKQCCFMTSFQPVKRYKNVHPIIDKMQRASETAMVGPMAAVAGAVAESIGELLIDKSEEVIIENGGDIYINVKEPVVISVFAGDSPLSGKIGLKIYPDSTPLGICTSSGTIGPSYSLGVANAATVISGDTALADAVATGMANLVKTEKDFDEAIGYATNIFNISGAAIIYQDKMAAKGDIEFCEV